MSRSALKIAMSLTAGIWFASSGFALGGIQRPGLVDSGKESSPFQPGQLAKAQGASDSRQRKINSFYSKLDRSILARFRPVERNGLIDFESAGAMLKSKTTVEKIFDKSFESKMRGEYLGRVAPFEKAANDPLWRPRYWEKQRYDDSRASLARWTTREVLEDQLKDFFNGGDKDSAPMKVLTAARELTGGGPDEKTTEPKLTQEQKIARAHRLDLPREEEEEKIPTKVKAKINVLRQNGSVVFTNPVATTSLNGDLSEVSLNMDKDFRKISLQSNLAYAMKQECLNLNVRKKITDQVSLDLGHYNYTGGKRGSSGEKTREQARVNYSVSF